MSGSSCARCCESGCGIEWHHPSGRVRGHPIHPFCAPLCVPCHISEHRIWARAGLNGRGLDPVVVVRRFAVFCGLQGLDDLADALSDLADDVAAQRMVGAAA